MHDDEPPCECGHDIEGRCLWCLNVEWDGDPNGGDSDDD